MSNKRFFRQAWLPAGYLLLILVAYLYPVNTQETINRFYLLGIRGDYWLHVCLFTPVPVVFYWAKSYRNGTFSLKSIGIALLVAILAELIHYFLPYRSFNPLDMLSNVTGILCGSLLVLVIQTGQKNKRTE